VTNLLLRLFVKDYQQTSSPKIREKYGRLSGVCGIIINLLLAISKLIFGTISNSIAITADAVNNLSDCLTSLLTILGFRWSNKPADKEHPFGHARIEYLVSLAVAAIIILAGWEVLRSSIAKIRNPEPVNFTIWAVVVMVLSILVKIWLMFFNKKLGKAISSDTLTAVAADARNDILVTLAALASLLIVHFTGLDIDGYLGAAISLVFFWSGYGVAKEALADIIGGANTVETVDEIKKTVLGIPGVLGAHDLVIHSYGPNQEMASIHLEIAAEASFAQAHQICEEAVTAVREKLGIELTVHADPVDTSNTKLQAMIVQIRDYLAQEFPLLNAHEFRIIEGTPKPKLVFDLEVPRSAKRDAATLARDSAAAVVQAFPEITCEVNIEYGFVSET
jgi:cation diffusion facilitator family transporter